MKVTTEADIAIKNYAKDNNIIPGENVMYEIGDRVVFLTDGAIKGLSEMSPADKLHSIEKGMLEYVLVWTMDISYSLANINEKYKTIASSIDYRFINFNRRSSVEPYHTENTPKGLSHYFSQLRSKSQGQGFQTGKANSSLSASRMAGLVSTLYHVIGHNNEIFPSEIEINDYNKSNKYEADIEGLNVEKIVLNALVSCLNVVSLCSKEDGFTKNDLIILKHLIDLNGVHMNKLYKLRNLSKHIVKNKFPVKNIVHRGIKQHHMRHLIDNIVMYGPLTLYDTQRSEKWHMVMKGNKTIRLH
jgi:hypothetical protein